MTIGSVQAEKKMMEWIVEAETLADLVDGHWTASTKPLVRCKDCKWWTKQETSLQGRCDAYGMYPTGEWYCARGGEDNATD